jgi:L-alanine-DL-glutamate epimerase-like enolase superfamily enzyme
VIDGRRIESIRVATILSPLPVSIHFGNWVMRHREFALCGIRAEDGVTGFGFCYTRDGPIAQIVRRLIAPHYVGQPLGDPESLFYGAAWSNNAVLAAGIGFRALSMVDIAAWDLAAKAQGKPIEELLGGRRERMPVTAIIGYPPTIGPDEVAQQVKDLYAAGWRRFKQPIAATPEFTLARLRAAREAADDIWLGMDLNWVFKSQDELVEFARSLEDLRLGWIEDIMPPGNARAIAEVRSRIDVPVAMGDEQGGSYHPEALLAANAVDVQRIDVSTNGGLTRLRPALDRIGRAGVSFAPHMFPHVHSRVLGALGYTDTPIEWGVPGTGVDQFSDALPQPTVVDGRMEPLPAEPGFGETVSAAWLHEQELDDPDRIAEWL